MPPIATAVQATPSMLSAPLHNAALQNDAHQFQMHTMHFCSSPVLGFSFELAASATTQIHSALLHSNGSTHNSTLQGVSMQ